MANPDELRRLYEALCAQPILAERDFRFALEGHDRLVVNRGAHTRGIWRCAGNRFTWTPAGYNEPTHTVREADAAQRYTLIVLATAS